MLPPRRILVALSLLGGYARMVLQGVHAFALDRHRRGHRPWALRVFHPASPEAVCADARGWRADALIVQCAHPALEDALLALGLPAVNVSAVLAHPRLPTVVPDNLRLGEEAARYFLERGYRHLAALDRVRLPYATARAQGFRRAVEAAGLPCHSAADFLSRRLGPRGVSALDHADLIAHWLHCLPQPVGIFAIHSVPELLDDCLAAEVHVPGEVAVLASDLDPMECEMLHPQVSCAGIPARRVGYDAAALLERLLTGQPPPRTPLLLPPIGVVTRASTRALAIADPDVRAAVAFIEQHAAQPITAATITAQTELTRHTLEARFAGERGMTIHEELLRARLRLARSLLLTTDLSTAEIARRAGFRWASYLSEVFVREVGMTPTRFREEFGAEPHARPRRP